MPRDSTHTTVAQVISRKREYAMKHLVLLIPLCLCCSSLASGQGSYRLGLVNVSKSRYVSLRKDPPLSTASQYKLADLICYIGGQSKVRILSEKKTFNRELWYQVIIDSLGNASGCSSVTGELEGWMIGRTKRGYISIMIEEDTTAGDIETPETSEADSVHSRDQPTEAGVIVRSCGSGGRESRT